MLSNAVFANFSTVWNDRMMEEQAQTCGIEVAGYASRKARTASIRAYVEQLHEQTDIRPFVTHRAKEIPHFIEKHSMVYSIGLLNRNAGIGIQPELFKRGKFLRGRASATR